MKTISKITGVILTFVLSLCTLFISPISIKADTISVGDIIPTIEGADLQLQKVPTTAEINQTVLLPKGTTVNGGAITVKVTDSSNKEVSVTTNAENFSFTPTKLGKYKVVYTVAANGLYYGYSTKEYVVNVTGQMPTLNFDVNNQYIIPTVIGSDTEVVLPTPVVTDVNGDEIEVVVVPASVSYLGTTPAVRVSGTDSQGNDLVFTEKTIDSKTYYTFGAQKDGEDKLIVGTYSLRYSFADNSLDVAKTFAIEVEDKTNANLKEEIKLNFAWADGASFPESATLGEKVSLPKPTVKDENEDNEQVSAFVKVEVTYIPASADSDLTENQTIVVDQTDFSFTPMHKAKNGAYYTVKYTMKDFYGNEIVKEYALRNVIDKVAPKAFAVANYDKANMDNEDFEYTDISYSIPSKVVKDSTVVFPAIYATDNYTVSSQITLERILKKDGITVTSPKLEDTTAVGYAGTNSSLSYQFTQAGTYTVIYQATDKASNANGTTKSYVIEVVESLTDETAPKITFADDMITEIKNGASFEFDAPVVKDYKLNSTSDIIDENPQVIVYSYIGTLPYTGTVARENQAEVLAVSNVLDNELSLNDNQKYEVSVPTDATGKLNIIVIAYDDAKYANGFAGENNRSIEIHEIDILNVNDTVSPIYDSGIPKNIITVAQDTVITMEPITFIDDYPSYMNISFQVFDQFGNEVDVNNKMYSDTATTRTVSNAQYKVSKAGEYKVIVTATDISGNSVCVAYTEYVADTKAPVIELKSIPSTVEVGETITLPKAVVKDDGVVIENYSITEIEFLSGADYNINGSREFTANKSGTYTFRYVASDQADHKVYSSVFTIIASDTIKPVITLNGAVNPTAPITKAEGATLNDYVHIPDYTVTDENRTVKEHSITVTDPKGVKVTSLEFDTQDYKFRPTVDGVYTIVYTATDIDNNSTTAEYKMSIGDLEKPVISFSDSEPLTTVKVGDKLSINVSTANTKILLSDNKTTDLTVDDVTVTIKNPSGTIITLTDEDDIISYEYTEKGTYYLTLSVTDNAGNVGTKVYNINVEGTTVNALVTEEIWGTVLIVVSVVLVLGVVAYFVITNRKRNSKKEK